MQTEIKYIPFCILNFNLQDNDLLVLLLTNVLQAKQWKIPI